ncbi:MAG: hypothetical protein L0Y64_18805, partial [Myxococcaceae bacterium]|nr:hypothetical protein [Myxococcaceae bacterium]
MEQQNLKSVAAPAIERPFAEVEAALERAGRVEELLRLYEGRARDVGPDEASAVLCRAAELSKDRLKNLARAEEYLRRALLFAPASATPLVGLLRLFEQKQDASGLAETLEQLGALASGEEGAAHFVKAADLYEQKLYRRDRAVLCLQRALRAHPADRTIARRVRALLLLESRAQPAWDSLERERAALGSEGMLEEYLTFAERLKDDPTEHALVVKALEVAHQLAPSDARPVRLKQELERSPQTWRDRVRMLRTLSMEERDRKSAARMCLLVAKLHAWYEQEAHAR